MPRRRIGRNKSNTYRGVCFQELQYVWRTQAHSEFKYTQYANQGFNLVRLAFNANQIQDVPLGALHQPYVTIIRQNLDWAQSVGMKVILDLHDFGRRTVSSVEYVYGAPQLTVASLADLWTKIVAEFDSHPAVLAYEVMNEPHDMTVQASPSTYKTTATVTQIHQQCIDAIRGAGSTKVIILGPDNWSNVSNFFAALSYGSNPDVWWNDPLNNVWITMHTYFNWVNSGIYTGQDRYLNEPSGTVTSWIERRRNQMRTLNTWASAKGVPIYIGEYNVYGDNGLYLKALELFLTECDTFGFHATYWPFYDTDRAGGNLFIIENHL